MSTPFSKVIELMAALRARDGCPWDRKQTHDSLKPYLLEETYEVLETIDHRDLQKLQEELGDVLLQVIFHSQIAAENKSFTIDDVLETLADKLIRRHPHVFGTSDHPAGVTTSEQVLRQWEDIKRAERDAAGTKQSAIDGVPKALPALLRAYQIQARASRVGFDWPHNAGGLQEVLAKITEEIEELREAVTQAGAPSSTTLVPVDRQEHVEAELGDILFSLVNLARFIKVNPEDALRRSTNRFSDRFHLVEAGAAQRGQALTEMTQAEMDDLWNDAKRRLQTPPSNSPKHIGDGNP